MNNSAMFSEVVAEEQRSTIYAFDRAFEGAIGACAMPLVGEPLWTLASCRCWLGSLEHNCAHVVIGCCLVSSMVVTCTTLLAKPQLASTSSHELTDAYVLVIIPAAQDFLSCLHTQQPSAATLAGIIAEKYFGFHNIAEEPDAKEALRRDPANATALSSSLLVCLIVPWVFCFLFYIGEHHMLCPCSSQRSCRWLLVDPTVRAVWVKQATGAMLVRGSTVWACLRAAQLRGCQGAGQPEHVPHNMPRPPCQGCTGPSPETDGEPLTSGRPSSRRPSRCTK